MNNRKQKMPSNVALGVLSEVYRVAENLYMMLGHQIPEGCTFSKSLGDEAVRCWNAATIAYYNYQCNLMEKAEDAV